MTVHPPRRLETCRIQLQDAALQENSGVVDEHGRVALRCANLREDGGDAGRVAGVAIVADRPVLLRRRLGQRGCARRVLVLEREAYAGVHSTGRSAALFSETYGSPQVRALTRAARPFLVQPPVGFATHPMLTSRGATIIGNAAQTDDVLALYEAIVPFTRDIELHDAARLQAAVPVLKPEFARIGLHEPGAADIDANELHQGFLRGLRARRRAAPERRHPRDQPQQWWRAAGRRQAGVPCTAAAQCRRRLSRPGGDTGWRGADRHRAEAALSVPVRSAGKSRHRALAVHHQLRRALVLQARRRPPAGHLRERRPGRTARRAARTLRHRAGHPPDRGSHHARDPPPAPQLGRFALVRGRRRPGWRLRTGCRVSSALPRKAATASRPASPWARPAPIWRWAGRCHRRWSMPDCRRRCWHRGLRCSGLQCAKYK
jgi:hypothetical protein